MERPSWYAPVEMPDMGWLLGQIEDPDERRQYEVVLQELEEAQDRELFH